MKEQIFNRANNACEFCYSANELQILTVEPGNSTVAENNVLICSTCQNQYQKITDLNSNHWRCLNEAMWSEIPAVQVVSWRMLQRLKEENWAADLLEMLYLEDETLNYAIATGEGLEVDAEEKHVDSNGVELQNGDSIVLIKDLDVKGTSFVAKRGTAVRNIKLVHNDANLIEGKVNGQSIYILTQYVKK